MSGSSAGTESVAAAGLTRSPDCPGRPVLATVSRGDPLTPYLTAALADRYPIAAQVDVELSGLRRAVVGALTLRRDRAAWSEHYMKSNVGFWLRSRAASRGLAASSGPVDIVVQTHALFDAVGAVDAAAERTVVYIDCTYRQAERGWPAWAPLRGRNRARWMARETALYRAAAHLFTFTEAARTSIMDDYGVEPDRVTTVGAGVNFRAAPERLRPADHVGARPEPTVLFVGKDFERKGGDVLLRAFAQVRRRVPQARLQIVGCLPTGRLGDGVEVLGRIDDRARMAELYSRATAFCLPSLFDPAPLVVLEAMSHGLPCVLSRAAAAHVGSVLSEGGGWVADDGDAQELAEGLLTVLQQPDQAHRAGVIARRAMAERYRWSDVVARMVPAIDAAAARLVQ